MTTSSASAILTQTITTSIAAPKTRSPVALGLARRRKGGRVRCASEEKTLSSVVPVMVAAAGSTMSVASPVLALVDERMSTEGTGLTLGLSNNLLGWILLGVFGLVWSLYFVYASGLDEDDDSGLSL